MRQNIEGIGILLLFILVIVYLLAGINTCSNTADIKEIMCYQSPEAPTCIVGVYTIGEKDE